MHLTTVVASAALCLSARAQFSGYDATDSDLFARDYDDEDLEIRGLLENSYDELAIRNAEAEAGIYQASMKQFRKQQKASGASKEQRQAAIKQYRVQAKQQKADRKTAKMGGGAGGPGAGAGGGGGGGGGDPNAGGGGGGAPPPDAGGGGGGGGGGDGGGGGGDAAAAARKRSIDDDQEEFYLLAREAGFRGNSGKGQKADSPRDARSGTVSKVPWNGAPRGYSQVAYDPSLRSSFTARSLVEDDYIEHLLAREAEAYPYAEPEAWIGDDYDLYSREVYV